MRNWWIRVVIIVSVCGLMAPAVHAQGAEKFTKDATLLKFLDQLAEATYQFNIGNGQPFLALVSSTAELLELFDKSAEEGRACIQAATDEQMEKNWTFQFGDQFSFTEVRTKVLRSFINHLIHHRAQLGVYLRLNGIPVPGMYGPSADEALQ